MDLHEMDAVSDIQETCKSFVSFLHPMLLAQFSNYSAPSLPHITQREPKFQNIF